MPITLRLARSEVVPTMGPRSAAVAAPQRMGKAPEPPLCDVRRMCREGATSWGMSGAQKKINVQQVRCVDRLEGSGTSLGVGFVLVLDLVGGVGVGVGVGVGGDFVAVVASRVSARRPTFFLCLAKERRQRKATPVSASSVSLSAHRGNLRCSGCGGKCSNSPLRGSNSRTS